MTVDEVRRLVEVMCRLRQAGEFVPVLEADVVGLLYHLVLSRNVATLCRTHLDTRIIGAGSDTEKYDLVIGDVQLRPGGVPAARPETVVEVKAFVEGFSAPQCRIRFEHILADDIRKLGALTDQSTTSIEFVYDERDYLSGRYGGAVRDDLMVSARNTLAPRAKLVLARLLPRGWQVQVM